MAYLSRKYINTEAIGTASVSVITKPIDITDYDKFSILYLNQNTAITALDMQVQGTLHETYSSASNTANQWVELSTAILAVPATLGATASFLSSAVNSTYRYIRILARTCQTAGVGSFEFIVGGHRRL